MLPGAALLALVWRAIVNADVAPPLELALSALDALARVSPRGSACP